MYSKITLLISAILTIATGAAAQVEQAQVRVDGLSCPFCAYGLEKKLKRVEGVKTLKIKVDKGTALMEVQEGKMLSIEAIEQAVKDGGFTPRAVSLTVIGRLVERDGRNVLELSGGETTFLIEADEGLQKLRTALDGEQKTVRITGSVFHPGDKEDEKPLYTISIEEFQIL